MDDYYSKHLSAERLRLCYEIAPPRVVRYLNAEIDFVLSKMKPTDVDNSSIFFEIIKQ